MPSAVMTTVLATEYNLDTSLVTGTILITTIAQPADPYAVDSVLEVGIP